MIAALFLLQTALTLGMPASPASPEYLPIRIAEAEGHFAAEGLQVSLRTFPGEAGVAKALGEGRVDLGATSLDEAMRQGHARGTPPRLVFGLSRTPPVALLVPAATADAIRSVADLAGKTVGIPAPGSPEHGAFLSLLARARVPVHKVLLRSLGAQGLARALASGAVTAGMIGEPWASRLLEDRQAVALADFRRPDAAATLLKEETVVHAAVFAPAQSRLGNAELTAVDRALLRALERLRSGPPEEVAAKLGADHSGGEAWPALLAAARGVQLKDGWVTADVLDSSLDLVKERAPIPAKVLLPRRLTDLLASEPLRQALGRPR